MIGELTCPSCLAVHGKSGDDGGGFLPCGVSLLLRSWRKCKRIRISRSKALQTCMYDLAALDIRLGPQVYRNFPPFSQLMRSSDREA